MSRLNVTFREKGFRVSAAPSSAGAAPRVTSAHRITSACNSRSIDGRAISLWDADSVIKLAICL